MVPDFGSLLANALAKANISQNSFARKIGLTQAYVSLLIAGKRAIPYKGIDTWPAILGLTGEQAEEFLLAGDLTRTPKRVLRWIDSQIPPA